MRPGGPSSQRPGAVPHRFRSTVAPLGTSAWLAVARHRLAPRAGEPGDDVGPHRLVELERHPVELGDGLLAHVVAGGAESAGGDHGPGPPQGVGDPVRDLLGAVGHRAPANDLHAYRGEGARDLGAVGVEGMAEQELVADGDELDPVHAHRARSEKRARFR